MTREEEDRKEGLQIFQDGKVSSSQAIVTLMNLPLLFAAWFLIAIGAAALLAAFSVVMLPHEHWLTGLDTGSLAHSHGDSLVDFVIHNRVSFGGALLGCGILYHWLITRPLVRGEAWAWVTLALSGGVGVLSFVGYAYRGYMDPLHGLGTLLLAAGMAWGLGRSWPAGGIARAVHAVRAGGGWRRVDVVRICLTIWAGGTVLGGALILLVGVFPIFVAEDLTFLHATLESFDTGPAVLLPFVAHDRIGFGGALVALGIACLGIIWGAEERDALPLSTLAWVWAIDVATAIGVHPLIGYNSLSHLLPFLIKDGAFLLGLLWWRREDRGSVRAFEW